MTYRLKACLDDYIVEHLRPQRSDLARAGVASVHLIAFYGADRDVMTLTPKDHRAYRAKRIRDGVVDSTIRRELGLLKAALNFAAEEEKIPAVPAVKLPRDGDARERWFTEDEAVKIMEQPMSDRTRLFLYIAFGTGARRAAIVGLKVGKVTPPYVDFRNSDMPPIAAERKRRVKTKLNDWLLPIIKKACDGRKAGEHVLGDYADADEAAVARSISREMKQILARIGIEENGISVHALRRTFSTWAFLNGAKPAEVSAATGDRIDTLEKSYVKLFPEHTAGATGAIRNPKGETAA